MTVTTAGQTCNARKGCKARAVVAMREGNGEPSYWCRNCWDRDQGKVLA